MERSFISIFGVAGGDHAVETGDSTAGDGDEDVRQNRTGDDRAAARDELVTSRHLDHRPTMMIPRAKADGTDFHVRQR